MDDDDERAYEKRTKGEEQKKKENKINNIFLSGNQIRTLRTCLTFSIELIIFFLCLLSLLFLCVSLYIEIYIYWTTQIETDRQQNHRDSYRNKTDRYWYFNWIIIEKSSQLKYIQFIHQVNQKNGLHRKMWFSLINWLFLEK